jgi:tRNA wybutosine-synthesizing protein 3
MRMAQFINPAKKSAEVIVDLYAGIGYYTLPFLIGVAAAKKVHACEWNPNSVAALHFNLQSAGVSAAVVDVGKDIETLPPLEHLSETKCVIYRGNNKTTASQAGPLFRIADRVCLGLLPSSVDGWPLAVNVLKVDGGILHVHENVRDKDIDQWTANCCATFVDLFALSDRQSGHSLDHPMTVRCTHIERVKSFSPHVLHIVVDLFCTRS